MPDQDIMREVFTPLTEEQKLRVQEMKEKYNKLWNEINDFAEAFGDSRELALAKTNLEQSCMWLVKDLTTEGRC